MGLKAVAVSSGGGGGGSTTVWNNNFVVSSPDTTYEVLSSDQNTLLQWNNPDIAEKTSVVPDSTGSLQIIAIQDYYGNSDEEGNSITIETQSGTFIASISTPKNTITIIDSAVGWAIQ